MTVENRALLPSGTATVTVENGPANTDLRLTLEPLAAVVGTGRTDARGHAEIPIQLSGSTAPGWHLLTAWGAASAPA